MKEWVEKMMELELISGLKRQLSKKRSILKNQKNCIKEANKCSKSKKSWNTDHEINGRWIKSISLKLKYYNSENNLRYSTINCHKMSCWPTAQGLDHLYLRLSLWHKNMVVPHWQWTLTIGGGDWTLPYQNVLEDSSKFVVTALEVNSILLMHTGISLKEFSSWHKY